MSKVAILALDEARAEIVSAQQRYPEADAVMKVFAKVFSDDEPVVAPAGTFLLGVLSDQAESDSHLLARIEAEKRRQGK